MLGAFVLGIGSCHVKIKDSTYPCYNTIPVMSAMDSRDYGLEIGCDKYVYLVEDGDIMLAIKNQNESPYGVFITLSGPQLDTNKLYSIFQGELPMSYIGTMFGGNYIIGGHPVNPNNVIMNIFEQ